MVTRYDWAEHRTRPVAVFAERAGAEAELGRLQEREAQAQEQARANGGAVRASFYAVVRRG